MPPVGAVGVLWMGLTGGVFPDYADLRSGASRHLRHRGVSHSVLALVMSTGFVYIVFRALHDDPTGLLHVPEDYVRAWTAGFALGVLSHLAGDACNRGGIQPFLPLSQRKIWLLPRIFRGRSVGWQNGVARFVALVVL
ncbi:MAG: metal-dependent hydrolase, partial [Chloroflexota bacterium]|nr:metal-dependent hydrolase [Chloroflexota bacterium]